MYANYSGYKLESLLPSFTNKNTSIIYLNNNKLINLNQISHIFPNLWHLDASNNKLTNIDGLRPFVSLGFLHLTNNNLSWEELIKLRHITILNLDVRNNNLPYNYRPILIHLMPCIWSLDGWYISAYERARAATYCSYGEGRKLYKFVRNIADHSPGAPSVRACITTSQATELSKNFSNKPPNTRAADLRRIRRLISQFEVFTRAEIICKETTPKDLPEITSQSQNPTSLSLHSSAFSSSLPLFSAESPVTISNNTSVSQQSNSLYDYTPSSSFLPSSASVPASQSLGADSSAEAESEEGEGEKKKKESILDSSETNNEITNKSSTEHSVNNTSISVSNEEKEREDNLTNTSLEPSSLQYPLEHTLFAPVESALEKEVPLHIQRLLQLNTEEAVSTLALLSSSLRYHIPRVPILSETLEHTVPSLSYGNTAQHLALLPPSVMQGIIIILQEQLEKNKENLSKLTFKLAPHFLLNSSPDSKDPYYDYRLPSDQTELAGESVWVLVQQESSPLPPPLWRRKYADILNDEDEEGGEGKGGGRKGRRGGGESERGGKVRESADVTNLFQTPDRKAAQNVGLKELLHSSLEKIVQPKVFTLILSWLGSHPHFGEYAEEMKEIIDVGMDFVLGVKMMKEEEMDNQEHSRATTASTKGSGKDISSRLADVLGEPLHLTPSSTPGTSDTRSANRSKLSSRVSSRAKDQNVKKKGELRPKIGDFVLMEQNNSMTRLPPINEQYSSSLINQNNNNNNSNNKGNSPNAKKFVIVAMDQNKDTCTIAPFVISSSSTYNTSSSSSSSSSFSSSSSSSSSSFSTTSPSRAALTAPTGWSSLLQSQVDRRKYSAGIKAGTLSKSQIGGHNRRGSLGGGLGMKQDGIGGVGGEGGGGGGGGGSGEGGRGAQISLVVPSAQLVIQHVEDSDIVFLSSQVSATAPAGSSQPFLHKDSARGEGGAQLEAPKTWIWQSDRWTKTALIKRKREEAEKAEALKSMQAKKEGRDEGVRRGTGYGDMQPTESPIVNIRSRNFSRLSQSLRQSIKRNESEGGREEEKERYDKEEEEEEEEEEEKKKNEEMANAGATDEVVLSIPTCINGFGNYAEPLGPDLLLASSKYIEEENAVSEQAVLQSQSRKKQKRFRNGGDGGEIYEEEILPYSKQRHSQAKDPQHPRKWVSIETPKYHIVTESTLSMGERGEGSIPSRPPPSEADDILMENQTDGVLNDWHKRQEIHMQRLEERERRKERRERRRERRMRKIAERGMKSKTEGDGEKKEKSGEEDKEEDKKKSKKKKGKNVRFFVTEKGEEDKSEQGVSSDGGVSESDQGQSGEDSIEKEDKDGKEKKKDREEEEDDEETEEESDEEGNSTDEDILDAEENIFLANAMSNAVNTLYARYAFPTKSIHHRSKPSPFSSNYENEGNFEGTRTMQRGADFSSTATTRWFARPALTQLLVSPASQLTAKVPKEMHATMNVVESMVLQEEAVLANKIIPGFSGSGQMFNKSGQRGGGLLPTQAQQNMGGQNMLGMSGSSNLARSPYGNGEGINNISSVRYRSNKNEEDDVNLKGGGGRMATIHERAFANRQQAILPTQQIGHSSSPMIDNRLGEEGVEELRMSRKPLDLATLLEAAQIRNGSGRWTQGKMGDQRREANTSPGQRYGQNEQQRNQKRYGSSQKQPRYRKYDAMLPSGGDVFTKGGSAAGLLTTETPRPLQSPTLAKIKPPPMIGGRKGREKNAYPKSLSESISQPRKPPPSLSQSEDRTDHPLNRPLSKDAKRQMGAILLSKPGLGQDGVNGVNEVTPTPIPPPFGTLFNPNNPKRKERREEMKKQLMKMNGVMPEGGEVPQNIFSENYSTTMVDLAPDDACVGHVEGVLKRRIATNTEGEQNKSNKGGMHYEYYVKWIRLETGEAMYLWLPEECLLPEEMELYNPEEDGRYDDSTPTQSRDGIRGTGTSTEVLPKTSPKKERPGSHNQVSGSLSPAATAIPVPASEESPKVTSHSSTPLDTSNAPSAAPPATPASYSESARGENLRASSAHMITAKNE